MDKQEPVVRVGAIHWWFTINWPIEKINCSLLFLNSLKPTVLQLSGACVLTVYVDVVFC